jgi:hypothetical protein
MNQILAGVDRNQIIKVTAIYLLIYGILNSCLGSLAGIGGAVLGAAGTFTAATGTAAGITTLQDGTTVSGASAAAVGGGILLVVLGVLYLISVPVLLVAAYGLFKRTSWSRMGAVVALAYTIVLSILGLTNGGFSGIIWIIISGFAVYLFYSDPEIKTLLHG